MVRFLSRCALFVPLLVLLVQPVSVRAASPLRGVRPFLMNHPGFLSARLNVPMRPAIQFPPFPSTITMNPTVPLLSPFRLQPVAGAPALRQIPSTLISTNPNFPMLLTVQPFPPVQATTLRTLRGGGSIVSLSGSGFNGGTVRLGNVVIPGLTAQQAYAPGGMFSSMAGMSGSSFVYTPPFGVLGSPYSPYAIGHDKWSYATSSMPYSGGNSSGYSGGYSSGGGYSGGGSSYPMPVQSPTPTSGAADLVKAQAMLNALNADAALDTLGLPHAGGQLSWPLGLRSLPTGTGVLRQQINTLLARAAAEKLNGQTDEQTVRELNQAIAQLRQQLAAKDSVLPRNTYTESQQFLKLLDETVKGLQ